MPRRPCWARSPIVFHHPRHPAISASPAGWVPGQPFSAFLATAHEWGHSLYEQGLPLRTTNGSPGRWRCHFEEFTRARACLGMPGRAQRSLSPQALEPRHAQAPDRLGSVVSRPQTRRRPWGCEPSGGEWSSAHAFHIVLRYDLELACWRAYLSVEEASKPPGTGQMRSLLRPRRLADNAQGCLQGRPLERGTVWLFPSYASGDTCLSPLPRRWSGRTGPRSKRAWPPARKRTCGSGWAGTSPPSAAAFSSEELVERRSVASPGPELFFLSRNELERPSRLGFVDFRSGNLWPLAPMANIDHAPSRGRCSICCTVCQAIRR